MVLKREFLSRLLILALGLTLAVVASVSGAGYALDQSLDPVRYGLSTRAASDKLVVVEMDAASVAAIKTWPWPRRHYAAVVDRLRQAGASSIVFDVDFSSASTRRDDAALAAALVRAGGIVALPTFAQLRGSGDRRTIDTLPPAAFREHAALASVNMVPDSDGLVRRAPMGTITNGTPRPSLSALIAGRSGQAGSYYPIDFTIDPKSIPRLSFVAVRDGRFDPAQVRGRDILIGATAIEMGDRYATPRWGVLPGVILQALGAETLIRGLPVEGAPVLGLLLAILLAPAVMLAGSPRDAAITALSAPLLFAGAIVLLQAELYFWLPLSPGLILLVTVGIGRAVLEIVARVQAERMRDDSTGLPNRRALLSENPRIGVQLAVATIVNRDQLAAVLADEGERLLMLRTVERVRMAAETGCVWRLSDRQIAFTIEADEDERLDALRMLMLRPVEVFGRPVDVTMTVGLATIERGIEQAIAEATLASDHAAEQGVFWRRGHADMDALARSVSLMGELDDAITQGHIELFYQPKLDIASNRIVSVEGLVRWRHPERGMISPDSFIPLAEQAGRIESLTLHTLRIALADLAHWRAAGVPITAALNISAPLLLSDSFSAALLYVLQCADVPASSLIFEVTESAAISDPERAQAALLAYRELGISISMDDYGTGQSTLSYFRTLPISEVKIDRSFVAAAHRDRGDAILVRSTVELAHELGLKVVAEGVEEQATLEFLRTIGCDLAQGYLISKPVPRDRITALVTAAGAAAAA
jgi:EAL domain-containing protein (putative c-di-GMP-specific phosphodiesterase class I)/CHASE2 domain-containing sensor protein